jgi:hypothetical protein
MSPVFQLAGTNGNVLGKLANPRSTTTDTDFTTYLTNPIKLTGAGGGNQGAPANGPNVPGIDPQGFLLVAPTVDPADTANYRDPFGSVTAAVPVIRTSTPGSMQYPATYLPADERTTGVAITLRRLANPYLPYNGSPTAGDYYNPYVTVDYMDQVPVRRSANDGAGVAFASRGKTQPYAGLTQTVGNASTLQPLSPVSDQAGAGTITDTAVAPNVTHTFGALNVPVPPSTHYDWLVHLDRTPTSPLELLHVSGYQPWQLTQQFMQGDDTKPATSFQHYVPWFDQDVIGATPQGSHRLYRIFEFLQCAYPARWTNNANGSVQGVNPDGRLPGKININSIWDKETLRALIDANPSLMGGVNDATIDLIFTQMMNSRSPAQLSPGLYVPGSPADLKGQAGVTSTDAPFLSLATGLTASGDTQYLAGQSITNTMLRGTGNNPNNLNPPLLLFENSTNAATTHPYQRFQLLTKMFNNVTTRSNVFAVWLTVGFFEVYNPDTNPTLGAEIGRAEGRHVRHRMFAVVDRTNLEVFSSTLAGPTVAVPTGGTNPSTVAATVQIQGVTAQQFNSTTNTITGVNINTGCPWQIAAGTKLVFSTGTNDEETIVVTKVNQGVSGGPPTITSDPADTTTPGGGFTRNHLVGSRVSIRGNPGPWDRYDHRADPFVVLYYSIIE